MRYHGIGQITSEIVIFTHLQAKPADIVFEEQSKFV